MTYDLALQFNCEEEVDSYSKLVASLNETQMDQLRSFWRSVKFGHTKISGIIEELECEQ